MFPGRNSLGPSCTLNICRISQISREKNPGPFCPPSPPLRPIPILVGLDGRFGCLKRVCLPCFDKRLSPSPILTHIPSRETGERKAPAKTNYVPASRTQKKVSVWKKVQ